MNGEVIPYKNRIAFEAAFDRPVTPNWHIQKLKKSGVTHITHHQFSSYIQSLLEDMCDRKTLLQALLYQAQNHTNTPSTNTHHNDNHSQEGQNIYTGLHDALIMHMDYYCVELAYLIKVSEFLPSISRKFGGSFCHLSEGEGLKAEIHTLYFEELSNKDHLLYQINDMIELVFPSLENLRKNFTKETQKQRRGMTNKDEFSRKFLRCGEIQPSNMPDRLEYLFLECYHVPLGLTPIRNKKVQSYIAKTLADEKRARTVFNRIRSGQESQRFPGLFISQDNPYLTSDLISNIARKTSGFIPKQGIVIG